MLFTSEDKLTQRLKGLPVTVRVLLRHGDNEISAEGNIETICERIDEIAQALSEISEQISEQTLAVSGGEKTEISASEIPAIKASKSSTENISLLFNTDWGSKPRTQDEVYKALEVNAVPDDRRKITVYLRRLTRKGELRRVTKGATYAYYRAS